MGQAAQCGRVPVARLAITTPSATRTKAAPGHLTRILGLGFGIAVIFGGTVGVGILRLPGEIAGQLGSTKLILLVWVLGWPLFTAGRKLAFRTWRSASSGRRVLRLFEACLRASRRFHHGLGRLAE